jgi:hypothetical protein
LGKTNLGPLASKIRAKKSRRKPACPHTGRSAPQEVIFRVKETDGKINFHVAYLFPDEGGNLYAVLKRIEMSDLIH